MRLPNKLVPKGTSMKVRKWVERWAPEWVKGLFLMKIDGLVLE